MDEPHRDGSYPSSPVESSYDVSAGEDLFHTDFESSTSSSGHSETKTDLGDTDDSLTMIPYRDSALLTSSISSRLTLELFFNETLSATTPSVNAHGGFQYVPVYIIQPRAHENFDLQGFMNPVLDPLICSNGLQDVLHAFAETYLKINFNGPVAFWYLPESHQVTTFNSGYVDAEGPRFSTLMIDWCHLGKTLWTVKCVELLAISFMNRYCNGEYPGLPKGLNMQIVADILMARVMALKKRYQKEAEGFLPFFA